MDPSYFDDAYTKSPTEQTNKPTNIPKQTSSQLITNDLLDFSTPTPQQTNYDLLNMSPPKDTGFVNAGIDLLSPPKTQQESQIYGKTSVIDQSTASFYDNYSNSPTLNTSKTPQANIKSGSFVNNYNSASVYDTSPLREKLTGIYAFFNSKELPPNPKQISLSDIPPGTDGIPFIFQNRCYRHGVELLNQYMKLAQTAEEKMYYRILKIMCMIKQSMWDKVALEYSIIGNLDKIIMDVKGEANIPFHLKFLYALTPFLSASSQSKSTVSVPATRPSEDKTIDRLFGLYYFIEKKVGDTVYHDTDLYDNENLDMFHICDADISLKRWVARLFRVTITIIEILLYRMSITTANEVIRNALQKFPQNDLLMAYVVRLRQLQGDVVESKFFLEKIAQKLPKDEFLQFTSFNSFLQIALELDYSQAKTLLEELSQKFPQYFTLAENNLAYVLIAEGKIEDAIEKLEDIIRIEPWNINEVIVTNLFYLYDFYFLDSKPRKKIIAEIIDRYAINFNKEAIIDQLQRG